MAIDQEEIIDDEDGDELNIPAIIIATVLTLALIGGGIWYFFIREPPDEIEGAQGPTWEVPVDVEPDLVVDILPELVLNPRNSRGRYYLIVKVDVTLNRDIRSQFLDKPWIIPRAKNIIIDIFSNYTVDELRTPKIKEEARAEIKEEMNIILGWTGDPDLPAPDGTLPPVKDIYIIKYIFN